MPGVSAQGDTCLSSLGRYCQRYHTSGISGVGPKRANRVIKLVFPTLCSPRKTSLNFLSGFADDVYSGDVMVMVESQVADHASV